MGAPKGSGDAEGAALFFSLARGAFDTKENHVGTPCSITGPPIGHVAVECREDLAVDCHRFRQGRATWQGDGRRIIQPQLGGLGQGVKFGAVRQGEVIPLTGCRFPVAINPFCVIIRFQGRNHSPQQGEQGPRAHGQGETKGLANIPGKVAVYFYGFTLPCKI